MGFKTPVYGHIPLAINNLGQKLSKQHHAKQLPKNNEQKQVWLALDWLKQNPPVELRVAPIQDVIDWGIVNWDISKIPNSKKGFSAPDNLE